MTATVDQNNLLDRMQEVVSTQMGTAAAALIDEIVSDNRKSRDQIADLERKNADLKDAMQSLKDEQERATKLKEREHRRALTNKEDEYAEVVEDHERTIRKLMRQLEGISTSSEELTAREEAIAEREKRLNEAEAGIASKILEVQKSAAEEHAKNLQNIIDGMLPYQGPSDKSEPLNG